jgi:hypothetical protein
MTYLALLGLMATTGFNPHNSEGQGYHSPDLP